MEFAWIEKEFWKIIVETENKMGSIIESVTDSELFKKFFNEDI